ncbi:MAG: hypothetical protein P4M08_04770 [Oligoflexia bacterium]|nr:hypothetical protein [Oligoflexia bacterium]
MLSARVTVDYLQDLLLGSKGAFELKAFDVSILPFWVGRATSITEAVAPQGLRFLLAFPSPEAAMAADQLLFIYRQLREKGRLPVIIVADTLPPQVRAALTRERCQTVITGRQLFAPELGILLNTKFEDSLKPVESPLDKRTIELSKTARQVLVALLQKKLPQTETNLSSFAKIYSETIARAEHPEALLTVLSHLSRAVTQLEELQLVTTSRMGRERRIRFHTASELWSGLCRHTKTIVSETALVPVDLITRRDRLFLSGESALSHYSNLSAPSVPTYAANGWEFNELKHHRRFQAEAQTKPNTLKIEHWKTDPVFLCEWFDKKMVVNRIDLALSLRLERDERVRIAISEMLKKYDLAAEPLWSY